MRMDVEKIAFTTVGAGATLVELDTRDCFQVGIAIDITAIAGSPTNCRAVAIALAGSDVLGSAA